MVIINRLVNLFRKDKEWDEAWKYKKFGVRRDEPDNRDLIYNIPTPAKNKKVYYYLGRKNKKFKGLNKEKKQLLKSLMGSIQSRIDFNKVRDAWNGLYKREKNK